ncbi:hypothetical protein DTW90_09145 [Neorhizobium sp. P12A]|uniref:hypothetical protein n=1 Tax=Neorhizobium sp. P12A TaxID=2268027 RepID=UPI0011EF52E6|nr:hypothetical protein [Neorhizobium sp. P12A]KAA0699536.1 hypothetical protein DTW90_09145 [Neorhizobium sp. P12A]
MVKFIITGVWACVVALGAVYGSVWMATRPAPDPAATEKAQQEYVKGESINIPVIANEQVTGYFLTTISFMMDKDKAKDLKVPLTQLTTDELFSLLVGNKMIDLSHTSNFNLAAFRDDIKKNMNERLGGEYVESVLVEQLDYLSKDEVRANDAAPVKKNLKPVKIVPGDPVPADAKAPAH